MGYKEQIFDTHERGEEVDLKKAIYLSYEKWDSIWSDLDRIKNPKPKELRDFLSDMCHQCGFCLKNEVTFDQYQKVFVCDCKVKKECNKNLVQVEKLDIPLVEHIYHNKEIANETLEEILKEMLEIAKRSKNKLLELKKEENIK